MQHNGITSFCYAQVIQKYARILVMDVVAVLRELAKHPLPDDMFGSVARVLVLQGSGEERLPQQAPRSSEHPAGPSPFDALLTPAVTPLPVLPNSKSRDEYVRITVRDRANARTTICLPQDMHRAAILKYGGMTEANDAVKALFLEMPATTSNRSGWVQAELRSRLAEGRDEATSDLFAPPDRPGPELEE